MSGDVPKLVNVSAHINLCSLAVSALQTSDCNDAGARVADVAAKEGSCVGGRERPVLAEGLGHVYGDQDRVPRHASLQ